MKKIKILAKIAWRGAVLTFREVFTGLMLGISALLILIKLSPGGSVNVGYLVAFGLLAGLMKGLSKFILMELLNKIPAEEYSKNYPKYKMMFLWSGIFLLSALANYGLNISRWVAGPAGYIFESLLRSGISFPFPGDITQNHIVAGLWIIIILGIASYLYEPVYND